MKCIYQLNFGGKDRSDSGNIFYIYRGMILIEKELTETLYEI